MLTLQLGLLALLYLLLSSSIPADSFLLKHSLTRSAARPRPPSSLLASLQSPKYGSLQHCGLLVSDVDKAKEFYLQVFGFTDDTHLRPTTLPYPGAFMNIAANFQIHLMQLPSMDPKEGRPEHGGRDRHVAVTINNIDLLKDRLQARNLPFTMSQSGRRALFCRDLDGNAFEFMEDTSLV